MIYSKMDLKVISMGISGSKRGGTIPYIYIYIYQHRQRGPTVFLEVDIFKGSHYGNPYSQGHTNC